MWARTAEIMLGCWLVLSPFIFRHPAKATALWTNDLTCGTVVILLSLFSFWQFSFWSAIRQAHLVILAVALYLVAFAFIDASYPPSPALQNYVIVGLLLLMFALVPTEVNLPPPKWQVLISQEGNERVDEGEQTR